jgi:hypothetical protein
MSNKVLKTTLLSLTAASLLTTSAYANIETTVTPRTATGTTTLFLDKRGTAEELFRITIDNTESVYSTLESLNIEINSTESNLSFLKNLKVFKGNQGVDNLVKNFVITDANQTAGGSNLQNQIKMSLDLTDVTSDKTQFINTSEGNPTSFILVLDFGTISNIDDATLTVGLLDDIEYTERKALSDGTVDPTPNKLLKDTLKVAGTLPSKTGNFKIDTTNPKITNITLAKDTNLTTYNYNQSFVVDVNFSENLFSETNGSVQTYLDGSTNLTSLNKDFEIVDSNGNALQIIKATYSQPVADTFSTENDTNRTKVSLEINGSVATVGDVFMTFKGGNYLKDESNNFVQAHAQKMVFDDQLDPYISSVDISFEDPTKGQLTFSEVVKTDNIAKWNIFGMKAGSTAVDYTLSNLAVVSQTDKNAPTKVDFTLSSNAESGMKIRINGVSDTNTTYSNLTDLGSNVVNNLDVPAYTEATFNTYDLNVSIVPLKWNLISIPSGKVTTAQQMFLTGTVQTVWGYENATWTKSPRIMHAGKGYWVKGLDETNSTDRNFSKTQTTKYGAKDVNSSKILSESSSTDWKLLGIDKSISWADAHSQAHNNCHTMSIYQYNATSGNWNADSNISDYSGVWVRQENCK